MSKRFLLASLHKEYFLKMLDGTKAHEHRNIIYNFKLPTPYFMVWYITLPTGAIAGISACGRSDTEGIPLLETIQLKQPISLAKLRKNFQTKTKKPLIILIKNKEIAKSYKNYFKLLWDIAKK